MAVNALGAVQARFNGELGVRLQDGIEAALVSFVTGIVVLAVLVPALPAGRRGLAGLRTALRNGSLRWWECLGGVCGAAFVASQTVTVDALGVAVFTVAAGAGLSGSSLLVDRLGLGPGARQPLSWPRILGAVLAVAAVLVALRHRLGTTNTLVLAALPALAGIAIAWQQAVNGRVRAAAGSALPATLVNFAAGLGALAVVYAVDVAVRGWPGGSWPHQPWLYLSGVFGIVIIAVSAAVVRRTGVLLLGLSSIAGQLVGALAIDTVAPGAQGRPGAATVAGVALALLAVGIAALPTRRPAPAAPHSADPRAAPHSADPHSADLAVVPPDKSR